MKAVFTYALCLLLVIAVLAVLPIDGESAVYDEVIRLHILAASDSEEDQADKLAVRDAILAAYGDALAAADRDSAARTVEAYLPEIRALAEQTLAARGNPATVTVSFTDEEYPARVYGSLTFPAGTYRSLRVVIDGGEGQNWWCVLFPPMCVGAASGEVVIPAPDDKPESLSDGAWRIVSRSGEYEIRFRLLELLSEIK